jgi:TetR/AcrR family transcriptional repressor of nem operon
MSDRSETILDAAEQRIRLAGYSGFSFREIAADVGVKSSSVHHHFPTKEALAAAVARRYTERFEKVVEKDIKAGTKPIEAWRRAFRQALVQDRRMCLCGILGAASADLPPEVAREAKRFFERGLNSLKQTASLSSRAALRLFATLEGAMLVATSLDDVSAFDEATADLG